MERKKGREKWRQFYIKNESNLKVVSLNCGNKVDIESLNKTIKAIPNAPNSNATSLRKISKKKKIENRKNLVLSKKSRISTEGIKKEMGEENMKIEEMQEK